MKPLLSGRSGAGALLLKSMQQAEGSFSGGHIGSGQVDAMLRNGMQSSELGAGPQLLQGTWMGDVKAGSLAPCSSCLHVTCHMYLNQHEVEAAPAWGYSC